MDSRVKCCSETGGKTRSAVRCDKTEVDNAQWHGGGWKPFEDGLKLGERSERQCVRAKPCLKSLILLLL